MSQHNPDMAATKAPASGEVLGDAIGSTAGPLAQKADGIFEAIRMLAENPYMSWEQAALTAGAVASGMAAVKAWKDITKDREDRGAKKVALREASLWRQSDESLVTYAALSGRTLEGARDNATSEINKFLAPSDPRVQALDIALRLPEKELHEQAERFPQALKRLDAILPSDAGVSRNYLRLAELGRTPLEKTAAAERAAFLALDRSYVMTAGGRKACYDVLNTSAARIVRDRDTARELEPGLERAPRKDRVEGRM